ncbi:MAG: hypothetical protein ABI197_01540 [Granulicella sp.]
MSSDLDKYIPEFDENEARARLVGLTSQELIDELINERKMKCVLAKMLDVEQKRLNQIEKIIVEPSSLLKTPGIPTADDIRRMMDDE